MCPPTPLPDGERMPSARIAIADNHSLGLLLMFGMILGVGCSGSEPEVAVAVPASREDAATAVREYMARNFGAPGYAASWYPHIKEIRVEGDVVSARTDFKPGAQAAHTICGALSAYVLTGDGKVWSIRDVQVVSSSNRVLASASSAAPVCIKH